MNTNEIATKQDIEELKELMRRLITSSIGSKEPNRIMDSNQTRAYLGGISEGKLKMLRDKRELNPTKIGGMYYYELKDITAMIERNKGRN